jgi:hypothetical protein
VLVVMGVVVGLFAGGAASGGVPATIWPGATRSRSTSPTRASSSTSVSSSFSYPWWRFVLSFAFAAWSSGSIVAAIVHYTMGGLAVQRTSTRR